MRTDLPMGSLLVSVYRSWAFTQRDIYEEFRSDDGVPYWYHRKTGQTFWERPLHPEEKGSPLLGASTIDERHCEEPTVAHAALEGAVRRVDQGQFRKQILAKHETEGDARMRRELAIKSLQNLKEAGRTFDTPAFATNSVREAIPQTTTHDPASRHFEQTSDGRGPRPELISFANENTLSGEGDDSKITEILSSETLTSVALNIDQLISLPAFKETSPQDMVRIGLGMGIAIMQSQRNRAPTTESIISDKTAFPPLNAQTQSNSDLKHPIGVSEARQKRFLNTALVHSEELQYSRMIERQLNSTLASMELARGVEVLGGGRETRPAAAPNPINADEAVRELLPVLVYPELSTTPADGAPKEIVTHSPAGIQTAIPNQFDSSIGSGVVDLRRTTESMPNGFYNAIISKHIAQQDTPYLPHIPNLPQTHVVGRVKPKSALVDWLTLDFDPWSAGRSPLTTMFIENLATQAGKLFEGDEEQIEKQLNKVRDDVTKDSYIAIEDKEGIEQTRAVTTKAHVLAADFKKISSLARHGKYDEVESLMNQSDWEVPINYTDEQGRTLLHIVCQNGNKRLAKLCLRRGIKINTQTLTGQTALHYAFGFGFASLGEYLISKGADDSIRNVHGLTCYEGLESKHITYL